MNYYQKKIDALEKTLARERLARQILEDQIEKRALEIYNQTNLLQTKRIEKLLQVVRKVSEGNFTIQADISDSADALDAIAMGINMMIDNLQNIENIKNTAMKKEVELYLTRQAAELERNRVKEIEKAKQYTDSIINNAMDAIMVVDSQAKFIRVNPALCQISGYGEEELLGKFFFDLLLPEDRESIKDKIKLPLIERQSSVNTELKLLCKNGDILTGILKGTMFYHGNDDIGEFIGIFRDETEQRQIQAQLFQASKLAALGELGTGIAHELNQPLTGITIFCSQILNKKTSPQKTTEMLQDIYQLSKRMAVIIQKIKAFANPRGLADISVVNAKDALDGCLVMLKPLLDNSEISLQIDLPPDLPAASGSRPGLEQVFLNLLLNAKDAIEASNDEGGWIKVAGKQIGKNMIEIVIADSGPQIPVNHKSKIFDPFFTTKDPNKGTGLGLSISYSLMQEMKGNLYYRHSNQGDKEFILELPIMTPQKQPSS